MGNMINRKFIITTVLSAFLIAGNSVMADSSDLLRMDVKKSSSDDTVDVTFYTTGTPTNTVVTRKSGNTYVVLLPNVAGNQSIVPALGGVRDLVSDVSVKNVDDGIGGYTKVTFNTTKPIKIQTYTKKTAPLTKAQQDYKNLIAQNNKFDSDKKMANFKKTSTSASTTATSSVKPAVSTAKTNVTKPFVATSKTTTAKPVEAKKVSPQTTQTKTTIQNVNKIASKPVAVSVPVIKTDSIKPSAQTAKVQSKTTKTETVKPKTDVKQTVKSVQKTEVKPIQKSEVKPEVKPVDVKPATASDLKNSSESSKSVKADNSKIIEKTAKSKTTRKGLPIIPIAGALSVIGIFILGTLMNIIARAVKNNSQLKEYLENYNSEPEKAKSGDYTQIADNDNLSWQEKYKLYSQAKDSQNQSSTSYVTNIGGTKGAFVNDMAARVSQMEHALSQTPSMKQFSTSPKGVQSEEEAIAKRMSGLNLKSFAKNLDLKMTSRQSLPPESDNTVAEPLHEGQHVKLKNSGLNVSRRNFGGHGFSISDLVRTGRRFLPKNKISDEMKELQEQYLVSSLEEYLSIVDNEDNQEPVSAVTEEITNMIPKRSRSEMMSVTNPVGKKVPFKKPQTSDFNISIKSKYDIDNDKSIFMVESEGVSALIGKIGENVYVLKKFDKIVNKPLQVRLDYGSVYIVKVGGFKCLVDVAEDKMGTLLEI